MSVVLGAQDRRAQTLRRRQRVAGFVPVGLGVGDDPDRHAQGNLVARQDAAAVRESRLVGCHIIGTQGSPVAREVAAQDRLRTDAMLGQHVQGCWRGDDLAEGEAGDECGGGLVGGGGHGKLLKAKRRPGPGGQDRRRGGKKEGKKEQRG